MLSLPPIGAKEVLTDGSIWTGVVFKISVAIKSLLL
jgi:hypothetical protein